MSASSSVVHSMPLRWTLQPVRSELVPAIHALEVAGYPSDEACSLPNFHYRATNAGPFFKVAIGGSKPDGPVLGFVVGTLAVDAQLSHGTMHHHAPEGAYLCIHSVCVAPLLWRQGLGRAMLIEFVRQVRAEQAGKLKAIFLICKAKLISFYQSCGFELIGPSTVTHGVEQWYDCQMIIEEGNVANAVPPPVVEAAAVTAASSSPTPVWLDCDPGHDDAIALILAGHNARLRLVGVSTVAGNQSLAKTTLNARNVLHVCGLGHLPVHEGRAALRRAPMCCPEIHGVSGLEGPHFPVLPPASDTMPAFEAMAAAIRASDQPITIVATGPLSNVALLALAYPDLMSRVKEVVLMGGAIGIGNTSPAAEFNIEVDAEAASIVFECGVPVVMVPLEVTHTALVTESVLGRIQSLGGVAGGSTFSHFIADLMLFFRDAYRDVFGFDAPPLHDPCAVAYVLAPELFTSRLLRVDVDCTPNGLCYGRTICDVYARHPERGRPNVRVCLAMKVAPFWDLVLDALEQANKVSCLNSAPEAERYKPKTRDASSPDTSSSPPIVDAAAAHAEDKPLAALLQAQNFPAPAGSQ